MLICSFVLLSKKYKFFCLFLGAKVRTSAETDNTISVVFFKS